MATENNCQSEGIVRADEIKKKRPTRDGRDEVSEFPGEKKRQEL